MFTKDYIRSWVTGDFCTDIVDAQGSPAFDARKQCWSGELCNMVGIAGGRFFRRFERQRDCRNGTGGSVSKQTGLPGGLPVIAGCSDTAAEDFSTGAVKNSQIIIKLATAGNVNLVTDQAVPHDKTFTYPYSVEGKWHRYGYQQLRICVPLDERQSLPCGKEQ